MSEESIPGNIDSILGLITLPNSVRNSFWTIPDVRSLLLKDECQPSEYRRSIVSELRFFLLPS